MFETFLLQCCACTLRFNVRITETTTIDTLSINILTGITYKLNNVGLTSFLIGCWLRVILVLSKRVCHRALRGDGLSIERFRIALTAVNGTQTRDSCWQSLKLRDEQAKTVQNNSYGGWTWHDITSFCSLQNRMRTFAP